MTDFNVKFVLERHIKVRTKLTKSQIVIDFCLTSYSLELCINLNKI